MDFRKEKILAKVSLIGYMGAGKTSAGRVLANLLNVPFYDTDTVIKNRFQDIEKIFEDKGEIFFRKIEESVSEELLESEGDSVIAFGGGAVLSEKTRELIMHHSVPVYIKCNLETAFLRIKGSRRPLVKTFEEFAGLYKKREEIYNRFPFSVNSTDVNERTVAEKITEFLHKDEFFTLHKIIVMPFEIKKMKSLISSFYITDRNVKNAYETLFSGKNGFVLEPGESAKTLSNVYKIYSALLKAGALRDNIVSYIGGGVVGDTAGFASSTFLRGLPLNAFPTTLLSMTDSAIGGKNGVNLNEGKNLIGTFYFPEITFINPLFLATLSEAEILNGSGEVFKYALLSENGLFEMLEQLGRNIFKDIGIKTVISKSIKEKLDFAGKDPLDRKGIRVFLNLGHTVGHALETLSDFSIGHGEGVAFGIIVSAFYSLKKDMLKETDFERICTLFKKMGFSFPNERFLRSKFLEVVMHDKKRTYSGINWILPVKYNLCIEKKVSIFEIADAYTEVVNENPCD